MTLESRECKGQLAAVTAAGHVLEVMALLPFLPSQAEAAPA